MNKTIPEIQTVVNSFSNFFRKTFDLNLILRFQYLPSSMELVEYYSKQ